MIKWATSKNAHAYTYIYIAPPRRPPTPIFFLVGAPKLLKWLGHSAYIHMQSGMLVNPSSNALKMWCNLKCDANVLLERERERERACETWVMKGMCVLLQGIRTEVTKAASFSFWSAFPQPWRVMLRFASSTDYFIEQRTFKGPSPYHVSILNSQCVF